MATKPAARPVLKAQLLADHELKYTMLVAHTQVHAPVTISLIFSIVPELACWEGWVVRTTNGAGCEAGAADKAGRRRQR